MNCIFNNKLFSNSCILNIDVVNFKIGIRLIYFIIIVDFSREREKNFFFNTLAINFHLILIRLSRGI